MWQGRHATSYSAPPINSYVAMQRTKDHRQNQQLDILCALSCIIGLTKNVRLWIYFFGNREGNKLQLNTVRTSHACSVFYVWKQFDGSSFLAEHWFASFPSEVVIIIPSLHVKSLLTFQPAPSVTVWLVFLSPY